MVCVCLINFVLSDGRRGVSDGPSLTDGKDADEDKRYNSIIGKEEDVTPDAAASGLLISNQITGEGAKKTAGERKSSPQFI